MGTSISAFKRYLTKNDPSVPPYYYIGDRIPQTIHCKLRLKMSDLNFDLFNRHLIENAKCMCGAEVEDTKHYLLNCPLYSKERALTIKILPYIAQNCETLLFGKSEFSIYFNNYIFLTMQEYINISGRFD